jgi:hypothetical protein
MDLQCLAIGSHACTGVPVECFLIKKISAQEEEEEELY